ncbi:MAG: hypothetical protein FWC03_04480 [Treponema sp.]|nr:hypothetical protein [Treponema sp.]
MSNIRKAIFFAIILTCFTMGSFGDIFYSFSLGLNRLTEQYLDDDYGKELNGVGFVMSLNYYPENFPLGWFIRTSLGSMNMGYEWKDNEIDSIEFDSSLDLSLSMGPSFVIKLGSIIYIPISIGPVISSYREESAGYYNENIIGFYDAINIGALLDLGITINPARRFIITNSIIASYDFLRWERGNMSTSYRSINSGNFKYENYSAFNIGFYFGLGIRFGGSRNIS